MTSLEAFPWGAVLAALVIVAGLIGGWYTQRSDGKAAARQILALEAEMSALKRDVHDLELRIERECVKRGDLNDVKDQIIERVKEMEHIVRNEQARAIGVMNEMLGKMLDRITGTRP